MVFDESSLVVDIRDKLKSLKQSYQGRKKELLKRLNEYLAEHPETEPELSSEARHEHQLDEQKVTTEAALFSIQDPQPADGDLVELQLSHDFIDDEVDEIMQMSNEKKQQALIGIYLIRDRFIDRYMFS